MIACLDVHYLEATRQAQAAAVLIRDWLDSTAAQEQVAYTGKEDAGRHDQEAASFHMRSSGVVFEPFLNLQCQGRAQAAAKGPKAFP